MQCCNDFRSYGRASVPAVGPDGAAAQWFARADANGAADEEVHQLSILITAMLGFASYKVAVVAAALTPTAAGVPRDVPANRK